MTESEAIEESDAIEWIKSLRDSEELQEYFYVDIFVESLNIAIQALEKQIPKKPIEYEDKFYACPICKNTVMHKWEKYNTKLMDKSNGLPVCLNCLQKLDWSDEE